MKITSLLLIFGSAHGFSGGGKPQQQITSVTAEAGRREALSKGVAFFGAAISGFAGKAEALDMDAFMSAELEADEKNCDPKRDPKCKPKLSADDASKKSSFPLVREGIPNVDDSSSAVPAMS